MIQLILEIIKYLIIVLVGVYTLTCFTVFKYSSAEHPEKKMMKTVFQKE